MSKTTPHKSIVFTKLKIEKKGIYGEATFRNKPAYVKIFIVSPGRKREKRFVIKIDKIQPRSDFFLKSLGCFYRTVEKDRLQEESSYLKEFLKKHIWKKGTCDLIYFVMERLPEKRKPLEKWVETGVTKAEKLIVCAQVLQALKILSDNTITHNDLHWANISVYRSSENEWKVKVYDWDKSVDIIDPVSDNIYAKTQITRFNSAYDLVGFYKVLVTTEDIGLTETELKEMQLLFKQLFDKYPSLDQRHRHRANPCLVKGGKRNILIEESNKYPTNCESSWDRTDVHTLAPTHDAFINLLIDMSRRQKPPAETTPPESSTPGSVSLTMLSLLFIHNRMQINE